MSTPDQTYPNTPLLARLWNEDGIWNISAFDLPIVAYGNDLNEARAHFAEAVESHLSALASLGRLDATLAALRHLAASRDFLEQRAQPATLIVNFPLPAPRLQAA